VIHFELELHSSSLTLPSQLQEKVEVTQPDPAEPGKVSISFNQNECSAADVISAMLSMYKVKDLTITDPKIETIVKEIYDKGVTNHAQILGDSQVPNPA
jgi:ABC-2 type transport system ATP-binding protein